TRTRRCPPHGMIGRAVDDRSMTGSPFPGKSRCASLRQRLDDLRLIYLGGTFDCGTSTCGTFVCVPLTCGRLTFGPMIRSGPPLEAGRSALFKPGTGALGVVGAAGAGAGRIVATGAETVRPGIL